jgi:hypothetical protein
MSIANNMFTENELIQPKITVSKTPDGMVVVFSSVPAISAGSTINEQALAKLITEGVSVETISQNSNVLLG